jgi:hypothetical protein
VDPTNGIIALKGTTTIYAGNKILSSDGNNIQFGNGISITGSIVATGTNLISGSSQVLNGSGIWSSSVQLPSGIISGSAQLPSGLVSSSTQLNTLGYATTGSNNFIGTQTITGSLYISQNLVVQGSSSLQDVTGSNIYIGTNKINLNTSTPSIRFGGVSVFDSGSNFGESGSLLWDSQANHWVYQHPASTGAPYGSAMLISGPKNSGSLGDEQGLTTGKIMVAVGDDHIGDSIMTQTNGGIGVSGSIAITGSITASGTSLVSGSSQISYSGLNGVPSGIISGSSQLPSGLVSGSVQIDVMSATNIARLATTGSNSFIGAQGVTGTVYATGQITSTAFLAATRAGANGVGEGPYVVISQPSESKQWLYQLNGVAGLDFWHYNGSSWSIPFYMTTAGATTITATDGSGARTTPFTAMTLVSDNTSNPYDGFGTALLFKNRIYSGGPTPGGIRDGARIRTSLRNNSTVNLGTDLHFDVTTTGDGALTNVLRLSYDDGAIFSGLLSVNSEIRSVHGGVDGTFSDAFVGVYSSNNNEQNAIQTSVSSGASLSGFRFQASNGGGSSGRTTVVDFLRDRQIFYTNVGIGTDSPNVKLEVLDTSTSSGEIARFQRNLDQINEYAYIKVGNASYPAYFGAMLSTYDIAYMSMTPNPTDGKALSIRTTDGFVGIGTVSPSTKLDVVHSSSDRVSARVKNTNGTGSASLILNPEGSGSGSTGDATIFYDCNTTAWVAGIDKSDSSKYIIANDVYGDFRANNYFTIQTNGNVGLSSSSPVAKLDVGGNIKNAGRVYSGNAITGNISPNLNAANTRNYILVCDLNETAGFSLNGFMNAASYTCWNMSSFYIMKNYSATTAAAGITGQYKGGGCDMNIVDLNYGSGRYIAIGYTSNPEIDVIWTGYRLTHMFASDGSATVVPQSNCTINSTLASY